MIKIKHIVGILCTASLLLLPGCEAKEDEGEQTDAPEQESPKYGVVAFEQIDDAYTKTNAWKYEWKIELDPDQSRDNTFELFKRTEIISVHGHADIHPQIARQVLLEASDVEKYKGEQLKFQFRIGDEAPADDFSNYGQRLSGWSYGISIGNMGTSNFMLFPGTGIANIKINKEGTFVGSSLELVSFETEKEGVKYKNRVVLKKTPVSSKEESPRS